MTPSIGGGETYLKDQGARPAVRAYSGFIEDSLLAEDNHLQQKRNHAPVSVIAYPNANTYSVNTKHLPGGAIHP